uniref:Putative secreted protein n=1 Tax=Rhipicephalus microplus TaxID=6941 RepID=A0A6M2DB29_RHIMP
MFCFFFFFFSLVRLTVPTNNIMFVVQNPCRCWSLREFALTEEACYAVCPKQIFFFALCLWETKKTLLCCLS